MMVREVDIVKQKPAYEMRISDWSSDVCSSDLLGDTAGTLGNHHEVDDDQNDEHHDTDGEIAAHQKVAEGFDNLTGGIRTLVPMQQDHPRRCPVKRQAQQGCKQQHKIGRASCRERVCQYV